MVIIRGDWLSVLYPLKKKRPIFTKVEYEEEKKCIGLRYWVGAHDSNIFRVLIDSRGTGHLTYMFPSVHLKNLSGEILNHRLVDPIHFLSKNNFLGCRWHGQV